MGELAEELRLMLAERAADAPPGVELLAATRVRYRRRRLRRGAAVAGLAVLAVGAGAVAVPSALRALDARPGVGQVAAPGPSPATTDSGRSTAAPVLFEPALVQPGVTFPYSPTFVPAGLPPAGVLRTDADFLAHLRQGEEDHMIKVELHGAAPGAPEFDGSARPSTQPVTVRGHAGTLTEADQVRYLSWQEKAGTWLSVRAGGVSRADLLRYAEGLRATPTAGVPALRFALVPVGMVVHETLHWNMTFARAGAADLDRNQPAVGVSVTKQGGAGSEGTAVGVGSRQGLLHTSAAGRELVVDLGGGASMLVSATLGCSEADLVRFAAGITVDLASI